MSLKPCSFKIIVAEGFGTHTFKLFLKGGAIIEQIRFEHFKAGTIIAHKNAKVAEDIEALLPWNISPEEVNRRYATYPAP